MNRKYRLLIVEDTKYWQNILKRASTFRESSVEVVSNFNQAHNLLADKFFHLAIIDLSLVKGDGDDTKGMGLTNEIFQSGLFNATKVIMISAYGTKQQMREAFRKYEVADFIPKENFNSKDFQKQIMDLLESEINLGIEIKWTDQANAAKMVTNLLINGVRVKSNTPLCESLAEELEDLLCRLFHKAKRLLIKPLVSGGSGAAVLMGTPFFESGAGHPVVVKFGDYNQIDKEDKNFKQYVQQFVGNARHTSVLDLRRSLHLGGIIYSLVGGANDKIKSFRDFYASSTVEQIRNVLQKLFLETCGNWYANKGRLELVDLAEEYQEYLNFSWERIERAVNEKLKVVFGKDTLYFNDLPEKRVFANPFTLMREKEFPLPTYLSITHGDLNPDNILLDGAEQSWLIDFGATGVGHILRDIAELDTAVRYELLKNNEATLNERLEMEETLNKPVRFSDLKNLNYELKTENKAVIKAYQTAVELRRIAYQMVMQNPADDMKEYYLALIYYSLNVLKFYSWGNIQREHALLSACLLSKNLGV